MQGRLKKICNYYSIYIERAKTFPSSYLHDIRRNVTIEAF